MATLNTHDKIIQSNPISKLSDLFHGLFGKKTNKIKNNKDKLNRVMNSKKLQDAKREQLQIGQNTWFSVMQRSY